MWKYISLYVSMTWKMLLIMLTFCFNIGNYRFQINLAGSKVYYEPISQVLPIVPSLHMQVSVSVLQTLPNFAHPSMQYSTPSYCVRTLPHCHIIFS